MVETSLIFNTLLILVLGYISYRCEIDIIFCSVLRPFLSLIRFTLPSHSCLVDKFGSEFHMNIITFVFYIKSDELF